MRGRTAIWSALAVLLALTACGDAQDDPEAQPTDEPAEPVELVGTWEATTDDATQLLWIDVGGFELSDDENAVLGSWDASGDTFVAEVHSSTDGTQVPQPDWLVGTHGYRVTESGWEILDDDGDSLATMVPADDATAPEVTEETRQALQPPAGLPDGVVPVDPDELVGRWVPDGEGVSTDPHLEFHDDGTWQGSDGCNGLAGRWALGEDGRLLTVAGPMTLIGCEGAPVGSWIAGAAQAGLDGDTLVLLDRDNTELGRMTAG